MVPQKAYLLDILSNNDVTFFIPPYQRNYEWSEDMCDIFFNDICKTADSNRLGKPAEHFFGIITYFRKFTPFGQPNKLVLIDGQQRITTAMLFLTALRDKLGESDLGNYIDSKYLKNNNVAGDYEYKIKLKQVESDWAAYRDIILHNEITAAQKGTAIYSNYRSFLTKLRHYDGQLSDLVEKGLAKFSIITVELQPDQYEWEDPQDIFESMNSLGKPLSLADLVRNYMLLGQSADEQEELYNKYWLPIERAIPGHTSDFIRDFMQAHEKHSFLKATENNYKKLYGMFKQLFSLHYAKNVLKELSECAPVYAYFITDASCGNARIDAQLRDLKVLNVTTAYSFLLALFMARRNGIFSDEDIYNILVAFRIYCLRKRLLGITAAENKNFPMLVEKIPVLAGAVDKKQAMFEILAKQENNLRLPNDIEMERAMRTMNFANFKYCRFYLALVEERMTGSRPVLSDSQLQIEHILPQKITAWWRQELGGENPDEIHQSLVNTIGNITLIRNDQELGNRPFSDKKEFYENQTGLQLAREMITNRYVWNADAINDRADWIIDYMLREVVPIPDRMRRANNFLVREGRALSFEDLNLIGQYISYIEDPGIVARVVGDKEVEFEGRRWRLSPLTRELHVRKGNVSPSGSYQGAAYWQYEGMRLSDIM